MSLPAVYEYQRPLDHVWYDEAANLADNKKRQPIWFQRVPELVSFTAAGWRLAQLCPGDIVTFTTSQIGGRAGAFIDRIAMVVSASPDWMRGTTRIVLSFPPETEEVFL